MGEKNQMSISITKSGKQRGSDFVGKKDLGPQGWIFCGGMKRSGSTLQYQLASELIERTGIGSRSPWADQHDHDQILKEQLDSGWHTFKSHTVSKQIEQHCNQGNAIALYIYRDIRDVVSSIQQKSNSRYLGQSLRNLIAELMSTDSHWRSLPKVYVSRYEDVVQREYVEVANIAAFLNIQIDKSGLTAIAEKYSYEASKNVIANVKAGEWVETSPSSAYHAHSLLHKNHLQGGAIGRYKLDLSEEQLFTIKEVSKDWLSVYGYAND